jgi:hypothetical protein
MKNLYLRSGLLLLVLAPGAVFMSGGYVMASDGGVMERIHHAEEPLEDIEIETAYQQPVKTVRAKESWQGGPFKVLARKDSITRFRCSVCHTDKRVLVKNGALFTHGDIVINHGKGENGLLCIQCHDEDNRDFLSDSSGKMIDFDHSYQLCGQCHFRQKRDWLGGAHGKRDAFWAGERVIRNCTTCHSPHSPAFKTKMPETYSLPLDQ